jgi:acetyl esterase/lipase
MKKLQKMIKLACFAPLCIAFLTLRAQPSKTGLTGKPDTSFTNYSAFKQEIKNHPEIKLVDHKYADVAANYGIAYTSIGSRKLLIDAFVPKDKMGLKPAIIIIFGGGWRSGNRMQHWPLAQSLSHLGYVCFTPEYRLSTEALFPAAVYDLKAAIRWVKANAAKYNIDPSKIVVSGFSAGGELAALLATTGDMPLFEGNTTSNISTKVDALIDMDGTLSFVHPESGEGNDIPKTSAATNWFGYSKADKPELWLAASPLSYADKNTPPSLFLNSSVARMHAGRDDYIKILNKHNIYTEVHEFDKAPHTFVLFSPWFDPMVNYMDNFIKKVFAQK